MNRYHVTDPIVKDLESYLAKYISFADTCYSLPLALWTIGTFLFTEFDTFPYVVITSTTKRSGKSRLSEVLSFACSNPRPFGAMTPATVFNSMEGDANPTLFFDEAEVLSSEAASTMRAVLNMGYRRGQSVPRMDRGIVKEFPTYCPKVFILIGDVSDTLKDRSIMVRMKRGTPALRFIFEPVRAEGGVLRERITSLLTDVTIGALSEAFQNHKGLTFLTDRDEELWTSLFVIASVFCPDRMDELSRYAVDIATEKTQESYRYVNLLGEEKKAEDDEYAIRLLADVHALLHGHAALETRVLLDKLKALPTSPWRKFRGDGLTVRNMADMLSRFGVAPVLIRFGPRQQNNVKRGYKASEVAEAIKKGAH